MATALFAPFLADDAIVYGDARVTGNTITKGDWVCASGSGSAIMIVAANSGLAEFKVSGVGIALQNNPWYDELGVARANTALAILRRGIVRVSGMSASSTSTHAPMMQPVFPSTTSSGIVGQTGATGVGPIWVTAALVNASGATGANSRPSGVAKIIKVVSYGSTGQWDILLTPQDNGFY